MHTSLISREQEYTGWTPIHPAQVTFGSPKGPEEIRGRLHSAEGKALRPKTPTVKCVKIKAFTFTLLLSGKEKNISPSFLPFFPLTEGPGLGCTALGVMQNQLKLGPEEGRCHVVPAALSNHKTL